MRNKRENTYDSSFEKAHAYLKANTKPLGLISNITGVPLVTLVSILNNEHKHVTLNDLSSLRNYFSKEKFVKKPMFVERQPHASKLSDEKIKERKKKFDFINSFIPTKFKNHYRLCLAVGVNAAIGSYLIHHTYAKISDERLDAIIDYLKQTAL